MSPLIFPSIFLPRSSLPPLLPVAPAQLSSPSSSLLTSIAAGRRMWLQVLPNGHLLRHHVSARPISCGRCPCLGDETGGRQGIVDDGNPQLPLLSFDEPQGTFVHVGKFNHRQRKSYNARNQIADVASSLGLSASRTVDLIAMIEQITEGQFGDDYWFSSLITACAHVVTRKHGLLLSLPEIIISGAHGRWWSARKMVCG